jgi:hypothetical protein
MRMMKAKELWKLASAIARVSLGNARFKVEHQRKGALSVLSDFGPTITAKGHPSSRTIRLNEDGSEKLDDGNYEFAVTMFVVNDESIPT